MQTKENIVAGNADYHPMILPLLFTSLVEKD